MRDFHLVSETLLAAVCAAGAIVAHLLSSTEAPALPNIDLGNLTATAILGWYAWHTTTRTIPQIVTDFRHELQELRETLREELATQRTSYETEMQRQRDAHRLELDRERELRKQEVERWLTGARSAESRS